MINRVQNAELEVYREKPLGESVSVRLKASNLQDLKKSLQKMERNNNIKTVTLAGKIAQSASLTEVLKTLKTRFPNIKKLFFNQEKCSPCDQAKSVKKSPSNTPPPPTMSINKSLHDAINKYISAGN